MATSNTALRISELDFDSIKSNLKDFLKSQSEFIDYDFDGSGMSILLDILAYNTHYMGYYLNMVGNEAFLDTAQLRETVISHAKHLNYLPSSKKGCEAIVNVKIYPGAQISEDVNATSLTLPKYTTFVSEPVNGRPYVFSTVYANSAIKTSVDAENSNNPNYGSFTFANIKLRQGEPITQRFLVGGFTDSFNSGIHTNRYVIPTANVDIETIDVVIQESTSNTYSYVYNYADDLTNVNANTQCYWLEENPDSNGTYTIIFGDNVLGKSLSNGNVVIIRYLETSGISAVKANVFTSTASISGYNDIEVIPVSPAQGGGEKETINQIRFRAPRFYTTQNRAVTKSDFEILISKDYPNIDSISVWGGEDNDDPVYGKVFISLKPKNNFGISLNEKQRIIDELIKTRSVMTVTPEIVDPDYTYITTINTVYYNPRLTTYPEETLKEFVKAAILDYNDTDLNRFDSALRISKLEKLVDASEKSILSSDVRVFLQKRLQPEFGVERNYTIKFNVPLKKGTIIKDKAFSYPAVNLYDSSNVLRECFFEEVVDSFTGVDEIVIVNQGQNYQYPPQVVITGDGSGATATARIVNGRVTRINIENKGSNYTRAIVTLVGGGGSGATAAAKLQSRNGTLRTIYFKPTGEKVVVNSFAGSIDYETGIIRINDFIPQSLVSNPYYASDVLTFNAEPEQATLFSQRNLILTIDEDDASSVTTKMIAEIK